MQCLATDNYIWGEKDKSFSCYQGSYASGLRNINSPWLTEKRKPQPQLQGVNLQIYVHTSVADQRVCMISDVVFSDCSSHRPSQTDYHNYTCRYPAQSAFRQRASDCNIVNYLIIMRKVSITHKIHIICLQENLCYMVMTFDQYVWIQKMFILSYREGFIC